MRLASDLPPLQREYPIDPDGSNGSLPPDSRGECGCHEDSGNVTVRCGAVGVFPGSGDDEAAAHSPDFVADEESILASPDQEVASRMGVRSSPILVKSSLYRGSDRSGENTGSTLRYTKYHTRRSSALVSHSNARSLSARPI